MVDATKRKVDSTVDYKDKTTPEGRLRPRRKMYGKSKATASGTYSSTGSSAKAEENKKYAASSEDSGSLADMLKKRKKSPGVQ